MGRVQLNVRIDEELKARLDELSDRFGLTLTQLLPAILEEHFDRMAKLEQLHTAIGLLEGQLEDNDARSKKRSQMLVEQLEDVSTRIKRIENALGSRRSRRKKRPKR